MLVFVDESGCSGFKLGQGSTTYFAVTAVHFADREEAQRCDDSFGALRHALHVSGHKEFHFSKDNDRIRTAFLRHVAQFDFRYSSFVVNKAKLTGAGFRYKGPFYKYPIKLLFENMKDHVHQAVVVYDKCGDHEFTQQLGTYLKRAMRNQDGTQTTIKKFRAQDSKKNNLIQLADMTCGAVMCSMQTGHKNHRAYRRIISGRERHVQFWPN